MIIPVAYHDHEGSILQHARALYMLRGMPNEPKPFVAAVRIGPEGQCRTCRHFIADSAEVIAEIKWQSKQHPLLATAERAGQADTRAALYSMHLTDIFEKRLGIPLAEVGLCETGYGGNVWVTRGTGAAVDGSGQRIDACAGWVTGDEDAVRVRSGFWRQDRDAAVKLHELRTGHAPAHEIRAADPCWCQSGFRYGSCHGRPKSIS